MASQVLLRRVLVLAFWLLMPTARIGRATPSLDDICSAISKQRAAVTALYVEYESKITCDAEVDRAGLLNDAFVEERVSFAFRGNKRFVEFDGIGRTDGERIPTKYVCAYSGSESRKRESGVLHIQEPKSAYAETNVFFSAQRWPYTDADHASVRSGENTYFLPECLKQGEWQIGDEHDAARGTCVVVTKADSSQKLWFDPTRKYALVRSEFRNPILGVALWTNTYAKIRQIRPGVFVPTVLELVTEHVDRKNSTRVGSSLVHTEVKKITLDVPESLFVLEPRSGEAVIDNKSRTSYVFAPISDHLLEDSARRGKIMMDVIAGSQSVSLRPMMWILGTMAALLVQNAAMRLLANRLQ